MKTKVILVIFITLLLCTNLCSEVIDIYDKLGIMDNKISIIDLKLDRTEEVI